MPRVVTLLLGAIDTVREDAWWLSADSEFNDNMCSGVSVSRANSYIAVDVILIDIKC